MTTSELTAFRAMTDDEREAVYRFRYSVYVEEMGRYRSVADHDRGVLVEPEDSFSVLYGVRDGRNVVGVQSSPALTPIEHCLELQIRS